MPGPESSIDISDNLKYQLTMGLGEHQARQAELNSAAESLPKQISESKREEQQYRLEAVKQILADNELTSKEKVCWIEAVKTSRSPDILETVTDLAEKLDRVDQFTSYGGQPILILQSRSTTGHALNRSTLLIKADGRGLQYAETDSGITTFISPQRRPYSVDGVTEHYLLHQPGYSLNTLLSASDDIANKDKKQSISDRPQLSIVLGTDAINDYVKDALIAVQESEFKKGPLRNHLLDIIKTCREADYNILDWCPELNAWKDEYTQLIVNSLASAALRDIELKIPRTETVTRDEYLEIKSNVFVLGIENTDIVDSAQAMTEERYAQITRALHRPINHNI